MNEEHELLVVTSTDRSRIRLQLAHEFAPREGRLLLPNFPSTRQNYLDAIAAAGCTILDVQDIGLDGRPYGDVAESAIKANGLPPICLVILGQK